MLFFIFFYLYVDKVFKGILYEFCYGFYGSLLVNEEFNFVFCCKKNYLEIFIIKFFF